MDGRCIICYRPLGSDSVPCPSCDCGRGVCPHHAARPVGEPTATQLYNDVKERRASRGHRVLTIPEIDAVLRARADHVRAAAPASEDDERQAIYDDVHTELGIALGWGGDDDDEARDWRHDLVERVLFLALDNGRAGSPPPTPGPTPERLFEVLSDALTESGGSHVLGPDVARARNAVLALLSEPAPPLWTEDSGDA